MSIRSIFRYLPPEVAKQHFVFEKDVIVFQVSDALQGDSARGDYAEAMRGVVRPLLPWSMDYAG